jgi:nucleoside-diphosphate-sugar epimerase
MSIALVTGATGFIGSHLVRRLVYEGVTVHVLCRHTSKFWRVTDLLGKLHTHAIGLNDRAGLANLVRAVRPEQIFHLASATVVAGAAAPSIELIETNLLGTINLIDACDAVDYQSLVCTGDSFEYAPSAEPLHESGVCEPETLHGISKLAATLYAKAQSVGRPIVTLRLFSTYGPGDNPRRLVPRIIAGALQRTPVSLSRPEITRDWIYVDDVVRLYLEAATRAAQITGNVFNAGSGLATSLAQIVDIVFRLTASSAEIRWGVFPAPKHDDHPWIASMRHTFETFQWRPQVSLEEGLRLTIDAFRRGKREPSRRD